MNSRNAPDEFDAVSLGLTKPTSPARRRLRRIWNTSSEIVLPAAVLIILVAVWEVSVHAFSLPVYLLPAPSLIWTESMAVADTLAGHTFATLRTVMYGFIASIVVSLPLAVLLTSSRYASATIYPLLVFTQSIPKVALAPILVVMLGATELPRVIVTFLVAFFPLVIAVAVGLLSVPADLVELGRSFKASRMQELLRIRLPYAIPFVFSGLKVAIALSVVGAVVGEFVNADKGLGYLIVSATAFFRTPVAFGALILLSVLGVALFQLVVIVERIFFPWSAESDETVIV